MALFAKQIKNIALAYTLNGLLFLTTVALFYVGFESK